MTIKKVLLLYISDVSGHKYAALAIEKALKMATPQVETLSLNVFNYTNPITEKIVNRLYMGIIKRTPAIWEYMYDNPYILKKTQKIKESVHKHNSIKLKKLFDDFNPDAVVCTQAFPCGMVADFKKTYNLNLPLIGVLTDYAPHSFWIYDNVDYYIVPSEEVKERFIKKGVLPDKIKVFGIPIDPKFSLKHNKEDLASKFGLTLDKPIILAMGGGQGLGPIRKITTSFKKHRIDSQLIVITGTNHKLFFSLRNIAKKHAKRITILKFVDNIDELMEISSLIITKAGGLSTAEALSKGLPILIIKPLPGQEEINTAYFLGEGAAIKVTDNSAISQIIQEVISNPVKLRSMRESAARISRPHASVEIAKFILEECSTMKFSV